MRERTTAEWAALLEASGVPCAPILAIDQVFAHPQVIARGMKVDVAGTPTVATPIRFDGERPVAARPPPALDEHGAAIRAALGRGECWPAT
jgi:crotonobetainyl-CoA:carnitine CoA-transferase CaiB-like acyl-CoA transferase